MGPFQEHYLLFLCPGRPWWLLGLLLLGLAVRATASSPTCEPAPAGLVSWWPGDGSAQDISGNNPGTLQEGATAAAPGLVGSAFSFDGTNHYVQIPNAPALCPSNLTLEAWICFADLDSSTSDGVPSGQQFIVFKQNSRSSYFEGYALGKTRIGDQDVFSFAVSSAAGANVEVLGATLIRTSVWYHVAALRSTNAVQLYINGQLEGQAGAEFAQDYGDSPLYFGTSGQAYWDAKFKGCLDEVALYDRALSASEIQALFAAGAAGKCKGPLILTSPQSQAAAAGHNVLLWVAASGSPPLAYQWRCNGTDLNGATGTSLALNNVQPEQVGSYTVLISNLAGVTISAPATLSVFTSGSQDFLADPNLNRAVATALGKGTEPVTEADLLDLTCLTACGQHITNLSGLEHASNLTCLTLSANGIEDLTPLGDLRALRQVALDRNRISDLWPLASLNNLTNLNLSDNLLGDGQPLASLTGLISLSLNGNSLSNLAFLQPLDQLRSLELGNNPITDLSALIGLTTLEELSLSGNPQIANFGALSNLTRLGSLWLRECSLPDLRPLKKLKQLRFLDLYNNPALTDLSPLRNLSQLRHLDLSWNANLTNCTVLASATNLCELYLRGVPLNQTTFLQSLSQLSLLNLEATRIGDLSALMPLTNLTYLVLSGNPAATNFSVLSNLTSLTSLELSRNALSDLTFLSNLKGLSYADLSFNQVSDLSPLSGLTNLTSLVLAGNRATNYTRLSEITALTHLWLFDAGLNDVAFLQDWTRLTYLNLEGNGLTNLSPLAGLTNLTGLGLSRNLPATFEVLSGLTNLASLRLDANQLTNLAFLSNLTQLTFLSLNTNHLRDLVALTGLTQLETLYLRRNWLQELEPLQQLPRLLDVDVSLNLLSQSTHSPDALTVAANLQLAGVRPTWLPLNQPPSLATLNQWHLARDLTWSNAVLVMDDDTPASQLVVTATSSSPELVSVLASPLVGTNNDRALTFAAQGQLQTAVLTLTVMDEAGLSTSTNVLVTVEPLIPVSIPDPQLEGAIRTRLNQPDRALTTADLLALTDLPAENRAITNLSGLEWALNLTTLTLGGNAFTNLAPLASLPQLAVLSLSQNRLTDVSFLAGLTNLSYLSLRHNLLTDLNSLPAQPPSAWLDFRLNLINLDAAMRLIERLTNQQVNVSYDPQREPPHLEHHGSWAIRANTTSRLPFIAWDNGQASAELIITVTASDAALVPAATVQPGAANNLWLLTATPGRDQTGTATLTLGALNDAGLSTNTAIPVTVVQPTFLPARTLGSSNLSWVAWGHAPWQPQGPITPEGYEAIQTGRLEANQEAWLETIVTGPGRLRYWWKVSSEEGFDWLEFYINDRLQTNRISGEVDWQQQVLNLPGGTHTLHWRYAKDTDTVEGLDTAWVGQVSFLPGPVLALPGAPANGWCPLSLYSAPDRLYDVQVSTNLATWSRLDLVQGSTEVLQLTDTNAVGPSRFYRLQAIWLEPAGRTTNGFQLLLHSPPDLRFDLQASTNLLDWTTLVSPTGALRYIDGDSSNAPHRFYRALLYAPSGDSSQKPFR